MITILMLSDNLCGISDWSDDIKFSVSYVCYIMPEVVEVRWTAIFLNHLVRNKKLIDLKVIGGRYKNINLRGLAQFEPPYKVIKVDSKGKFLYFELEGGVYIMNRFGMEGQWGTKLLPHAVVDLEFNNGTHLYFTDSRHFGTIEIVYSREELDKELNSLGPDLLQTSFTDDELCERIRKFVEKSTARGNRPLVKVLMDQKTGIGSGIGNYLGAEIMYRSKLSPHTPMKTLTDNPTKCRHLAHAIRYITKLSFESAEVGYMDHMDNEMETIVRQVRNEIKKNPDHEHNYHPDINIDNHKFQFVVYRQKKDPHGHEVKGEKIIPGRTTYWVPIVQK